MTVTSWSSASIYMADQVRHPFLHNFLRVELDNLYQNKQLFNYYVNLSTGRGSHIIIFMEVPEVNVMTAFLNDKARKFITASEAVASSGNQDLGNFLFQDITGTEIFLNHAKLKGEPFMYLSDEQRLVYYKVLRRITGYLIGLSEENYNRLIENRFVFCFSTALGLLKNLGSGNAYVIIDEVVHAALTDAETKLGRNLEDSLRQNFEANEEYLISQYHKPLNEIQGMDELARDLTGYIKNELVFAGEGQEKVFVTSLLAEVYDIFDLQHVLACNYFLKKVLAAVS